MSITAEELVIDGLRVDANISRSIIAATHTRTMDGAASLDLTVHDPDMRLLLSGALTKPGRPSARQKQFREAAWDRFGVARLALDGVFFRLAGIDPSYDASEQTIRLTFEDEVAAIMRSHHKAIKFGRGQRIEPGKHGLRPATRADFIRNMFLTAEYLDGRKGFGTSGRFFSPQRGLRQPIETPDVPHRSKGLHDGKHLTVKGNAISSEQRRLLARSLTVADDNRAGELATLALLVAEIQESTVHNLVGGDGTSSGILQVTAPTARGHGIDPRDVEAVVKDFLTKGFYGKGGAISLAAKNPDSTAGEIAQDVQGSAFPTAYDPWTNEAKAILDAWGGAGKQFTIRERFEFKAGGKDSAGNFENYWDASSRLADEVNWRRFADLNILYFLTDDWLFQRRPRFTIDGGDGLAGLTEQGVTSFQPSVDIGKPFGEILLNVEAPRWTIPPGCVFDFDHMGPLTGRWLAWEVQHDLMARTERAQVTLRRPSPKKKEPAPQVTTGILSESRPEAGSVRARIVATARKAHRQIARYRYEQRRPMPGTLFPSATGSTVYIDCSAFATLCYKAAGAPDPNGGNYDGGGYTGTLAANGKRTSDPQPGDLAFYGSGPPWGHVGVYIGGGKVIEMGGTPGPLEINAKYRSDGPHYYTYDLGSG